MSRPVTPCPPETARVHPREPERQMTMTTTQSQALPAYDLPPTQDLGACAGGRGPKHSAFTDAPARSALGCDARCQPPWKCSRPHRTRFADDRHLLSAAVNPVAAGMTTKRFANIRSDFLAAVKASGLIPIGAWHKGPWRQPRASSSRASHIDGRTWASRASRGMRAPEEIDPEAVNDVTVADFINAVREQSLHGAPNWLYRQVTLIWNKAACDATLGLQLLTVPSFRGPPKRIDWALLSSSFRRDVDKYLEWASQSDPFAPRVLGRDA